MEALTSSHLCRNLKNCWNNDLFAYNASNLVNFYEVATSEKSTQPGGFVHVNVSLYIHVPL
jgi:hypothetical protein